ncbi:tetratricopeptide repeat-containing sulfotransferase family protein [Tropicibacter naphthalenivorans]
MRLLEGFPDSYDTWQLLGAALFATGQDATRVFERASSLRPDQAEAWQNLGVAYLTVGQPEQAAKALTRGLKVVPNSYGLQFHLGAAMESLGHMSAAQAHFRAALAQDRRAEAWVGVGRTCLHLGQIAEARRAMEAALDLEPEAAVALNLLGAIHLMQGDTAQAKARFEQAIAVVPSYAEPHRRLSEILDYTQENEHFDQLAQQYEQSDAASQDRAIYCFALAEAHEQRQEFEAAFRFLSEGNTVQRALIGYEPSQDAALFERVREVAQGIAPLPAGAEVRPIFIVGMPRSGTTLIEQMLSNHSAIAAAGEVPYLGELLAPFLQGADLTQAALAGIRTTYLGQLRRHAADRSLVTDKTPQNFLFVGVIRALFPEAGILHVQRDPGAVCWSNFRKLFSDQRLGYSFDLGDCVAYYRRYRDLMGYWGSEGVHQLRYEQLVAMPEVEVQRILAGLGLDFEPDCTRPQENARSVMTASLRQVRRGIYGGSSDRWKQYAPFIKDAFAPLSLP